MIDRSTWQQGLAKKAQSMGVSIKKNFPVEKNQLPELLDTYEYIIDASGAPSVTSKIHGFVPKYIRNAGLIAQYVIEGDFGFLGKNTIMAGYEPHYIGYYWIFPKGKNIANVGVVRFNVDKKNMGLHLYLELDRILKKEGLDGYKILRNFKIYFIHKRTPAISCILFESIEYIFFTCRPM